MSLNVLFAHRWFTQERQLPLEGFNLAAAHGLASRTCAGVFPTRAAIAEMTGTSSSPGPIP